MDDAKLASLLNRLEMHMRDSKVHLLIKEAIDTITVQSKRIKDLESVVDMMDSGLCNYINGCEDPYEPVSKWDESSKRDFEELCRVYNDWHKHGDDIGKISMDRFVETQDDMRRIMVRSLKENLYRAKASKEAQDIIESMIRRYEDNGMGGMI